MTVSRLPVPPSPSSRRAAHPHHVLLDAVGHAVGEVVRALLDDDRVAARGVLRDGVRRQTLVLSAQTQAHQTIVGSERRPQAVQDLLFLADVARISRLVDELARLVLTGGAAPDGTAASQSRVDDMLLLGRFGEERLHQLADGVRAPELSSEFVRCGRCLLEAADRLGSVTVHEHGHPQPCVSCCADLATAVLQASRHALRSAAV